MVGEVGRGGGEIGYLKGAVLGQKRTFGELKRIGCAKLAESDIFLPCRCPKRSQVASA